MVLVLQLIPFIADIPCVLHLHVKVQQLNVENSHVDREVDTFIEILVCIVYKALVIRKSENGI